MYHIETITNWQDFDLKAILPNLDAAKKYCEKKCQASLKWDEGFRSLEFGACQSWDACYNPIEGNGFRITLFVCR